MTIALNGALATELTQSGRQGKPLTALAVVTDVPGTAWGSCGTAHRILYVDDIEVGKDTQTSLVELDRRPVHRRWQYRSPGTLWSGLIDDIRIYNRMVKP